MAEDEVAEDEIDIEASLTGGTGILMTKAHLAV